MALAENHQWARNEKGPWKAYFEAHLAGTRRPRPIGDGTAVRFGALVSYINYTHTYDAFIGISCDTGEAPSLLLLLGDFVVRLFRRKDRTPLSQEVFLVASRSTPRRFFRYAPEANVRKPKAVLRVAHGAQAANA